jgi:putative peptide zinc metalloprotease protein
MDWDYPKLRDDLIITLQIFQDVTYYVIKDPLTNKYFRVKEPEHFILRKLDGKTDFKEISSDFEAKFGIPLKEETFKPFISHSENLGFFEMGETQREFTHLQYQMSQKKNLLQRIILIKLKAFDPDKLLEWLLKKFRFVFSRKFLLISLVLVFLAIVITPTNWDGLKRSFADTINLGLVIKLWLAILLISGLHEIAHGLTCKYFGGEVHEMGFLLLYFQPCFYCNVSDAWLFPDKKKKMLVTFAGAYLNILLWATATIFWRVLDFDTWMNGFLFVVLFLSSITTIFNFNPLIKLDGYYLLSDYLEIPNLRKKAFDFLGNWFRRIILGFKEIKLTLSGYEKKVYFSYGILALSYTILLVAIFFFRVGNFLVSRYQGLGFVLFLILTFAIFKTPIRVGLAGIFGLFLSKKGIWMKPKRIITYAAIIVIVLVLLFLVKLELKISAECEIQPLESYSISTTPDGYVMEEIFKEGNQEKRSVNLFKLISGDYALVNMESMVKEGDKVKPGDLIASFASSQNLSDLSSTQAQLESAIANYQLLKKGAQPEEISQAEDKAKQGEASLKLKQKDLERLRNLHKGKLISDEELERGEADFSIAQNGLEIERNQLKLLERGARPEELKMARSEIDQLETRVRFLEEQMSSSQIKSPISGMVTSIQQQTNLISIANLDTVRVSIKVSEKDLDVICVGQKTKLKVRSYPWISFYGKVTKISNQAQENSSKNIFLITSKVPNLKLQLKPGMSGQAKINCGKRSIFNLLTRRIVRYLRVEVWSWW